MLLLCKKYFTDSTKYVKMIFSKTSDSSRLTNMENTISNGNGLIDSVRARNDKNTQQAQERRENIEKEKFTERSEHRKKIDKKVSEKFLQKMDKIEQAGNDHRVEMNAKAKKVNSAYTAAHKETHFHAKA
jgi:TolA-binding protein